MAGTTAAVKPLLQHPNSPMAMAALRPSEFDIEAEMTGLDLKPRRPDDGHPSLLVLRLAVTEIHNWYGIGGRSGRLRRPRRLSRVIWLPLASSGPDYLRSGDDCRRLIARTTMHELRKEEGYHGLSAADWDKTVPEGVEALIAERARALPGGGACKCEVSIRVGVEFVYSEAAELLSACTDAGDLTCRRSTSGDGAASPCSICFEEMAPDDAEATCLPGCAHGFHGSCIGSWFEKASTCPVCRRDKLQFLPPDYRAVHDMMLSDPEGSC